PALVAGVDPAAGAVEQRQLAAEVLQHHLGGVALDPLLVGPLAGLQRALEVDLRALLQILLGDAAEVFVEDDNPVPLGALALLARPLVAPALRGSHAQIRNRPPVLGAPDFRIRPEIADQDHLVHRACHDTLRFPPPEPVNLVSADAPASTSAAFPQTSLPEAPTLPHELRLNRQLRSLFVLASFAQRSKPPPHPRKHDPTPAGAVSRPV